MKKRHSPCSTASAKLRRQSLDWGLGAIGAHAWQAHVKACVIANDGEERFCAKLVGKCPRYKIVCNSRLVHIEVMCSCSVNASFAQLV